MNLIFEKDIKTPNHFEVILLINAVTERRFDDFINAIVNKDDWIEELCCCYFQVKNNNDGYLFETCEGNEFYMLYEEFIEYVKLAIIRYLVGCKAEENKQNIKHIVSNTILSDLLNNVPSSSSLDIPLVYGRNIDDKIIKALEK